MKARICARVGRVLGASSWSRRAAASSCRPRSARPAAAGTRSRSRRSPAPRRWPAPGATAAAGSARRSGTGRSRRSPRRPGARSGSVAKNGRRITIVIGSPNAAWGRATPSGLSSRPRLRTMMKIGRIATATGNSSPSVKTRVEQLAAREREAREDERRQRGQRHGQQRRDDRDQRAVADLAPERAASRGSRRSWRTPTGPAARPGPSAIWPVSRKPPSTA